VARAVHGDADLAVGLRDLLRGAHPAAAVAVVAASGPRIASYTAPLPTEYEIGSLSKPITGLLYADALDRGSVEATTALGDLLPLDGDVGRIELAALATHRSGLPRMPKQPSETFVRTWHLWVDGENPYGDSLETLLSQARATPVGAPKHRYSNLGYMLLGHALAAADGTTYDQLLRRRIADPLGMAGEGLGPAGGIRSSIGDMAVLVGALLDGSAPGIAALEPVERFAGPAVQIGAAWMVLSRKGRTITWHNGQTGGFASWLGLDRAAGVGVVILTATSASVDRHGFELLEAVTP